MQVLQHDPFANILKSHKLKGKFEGSWACSVDYELRIIFQLVKNPTTGVEEILLIDIGTHDEVY
jgi:mRNA-degrading endonuclease YafQ of YafQ-DinJ toxin-antitoxin module